VARLRRLPMRRRLPVRRLWLRLARLRRLSLRRLWLLGMGPLPLVGTLRPNLVGRLKSPGQHYGGWPGLMCASVPTERAIGTQAQCSAAVNRRVRLGQACFVAAYQAGSRVARACGRALESSPCRPGPTSVASERPCSSVILIFAIP
jgi:hypothetical protein